jgi:hypothetical protein
MKINKLTLIALLAGAPAAVLADSHFDIGVSIAVPPPGAVVVGNPPPPPAAETIVPAPGPDFVWVTGHWAWKGHWRHWVWARGHWARRPWPGAVWLSGRWAPSAGGWVWLEGRWAAQQPSPVVSQEVVVSDSPPPPVAEAIYPAPGPDFFWISGYWAWEGRWMWRPGHYERHPHFHPGAGWTDGHWDRRGGGFVWVPGRWR